MFKRRLFILLGIALLGLANVARSEEEVLVLDDTTPTSGCPCRTPTCTPTPPCPCLSTKGTPVPAAQAQTVPTPIPRSAPLVRSQKIPVSNTPSSASSVSSNEDEEITLDEGEVSSPAAHGAAKPMPAAPPLPKAGAEAKAEAPPRSTPSPTPMAALASPTPDDSQWIQEDRILKENDLRTQFGQLDKPLFRATLDGVYSQAFDTNLGNNGFSNGFGGDLRVEVQFYKPLSLGLYYDFVLFPVPGANVLTGPMGLFVRIIPLHNGLFEGYVIAGGGINSLVSSNNLVHYPEDFHAFAGLGFTQSFGDHWGLDVNAVYNYYSPDSNPLRTVSGRLGLTYAMDLDQFLKSLTGSGKSPSLQADHPKAKNVK